MLPFKTNLLNILVIDKYYIPKYWYKQECNFYENSEALKLHFFD